MATSFLSSLFKPKDELLQDLDFVAACDDEVVESDELKQKFTRIKMRIEPSYRQEERIVTMKYIQEAVYDTKRWRRVYNGLRLLERVMQIQIMAEEQREGRHFDVVQQCSLLMSFSHEDKRVTNLVRQRAQKVREKCLDLLNLADSVPTSSQDHYATSSASSTRAPSAASRPGEQELQGGGAGGYASSNTWSSTSVDLLGGDIGGGRSTAVQNIHSAPSGSAGPGGRSSQQSASSASTPDRSYGGLTGTSDLAPGGATSSPFSSSSPPLPQKQGVYANFYQSDRRGAALTSNTGNTICYTKHREDTDSEDEGDAGGRGSALRNARFPAPGSELVTLPTPAPPPPPGGTASSSSSAAGESATVTNLIDL